MFLTILLHGETSEEWVTGLTQLREHFQDGSIPAVRQPMMLLQGFFEDRDNLPACYFSTLNDVSPARTGLLKKL
jgi:hypothetical protein